MEQTDAKRVIVGEAVEQKEKMNQQVVIVICQSNAAQNLRVFYRRSRCKEQNGCRERRPFLDACVQKKKKYYGKSMISLTLILFIKYTFDTLKMILYLNNEVYHFCSDEMVRIWSRE